MKGDPVDEKKHQEYINCKYWSYLDALNYNNYDFSGKIGNLNSRYLMIFRKCPFFCGNSIVVIFKKEVLSFRDI